MCSLELRFCPSSRTLESGYAVSTGMCVDAPARQNVNQVVRRCFFQLRTIKQPRCHHSAAWSAVWRSQCHLLAASHASHRRGMLLQLSHVRWSLCTVRVLCIISLFTCLYCLNSIYEGGSVAEWLACWTQAQKGPGSNRSRDAVG